MFEPFVESRKLGKENKAWPDIISSQIILKIPGSFKHLPTHTCQFLFVRATNIFNGDSVDAAIPHMEWEPDNLHIDSQDASPELLSHPLVN